MRAIQPPPRDLVAGQARARDLAAIARAARLPAIAAWLGKHPGVVRELLEVARAPTAAEAFAGGGLLSLALYVEGVRAVDVCECEPSAVRTLEYNLHGKGGVHGCNARTWSPPAGTDLLVGGPPCQPWSLAGDQRGSDDPRDMWPEVMRWAREVRPAPRVMAWENSANMLSVRNRVHVDRMRAELRGYGFDTAVWKLNAADYGDPQRRDRAWLIVWPAGAAWGRILQTPPPPTHADPRAPIPPGLLPWVRAFDRLNMGCCGGFGLNDCARIGNLDRQCEGCHEGSNYVPAPNNDPADVSGEAAEYLVRDSRRLHRHPVTDLGGARAWEPTPEGASMAGAYLAAAPTKSWRAKSPYGLVTRPGAPKLSDHPEPAELEERLRFASPREAAKLMGVPSWYAFVGNRREQLAQIGNGVPLGMGRSVVRHLLRALGYTVPLPGSLASKPHEGLFPLDSVELCTWWPKGAPAGGGTRPRHTATPEAHAAQEEEGGLEREWRELQDVARRELGTGDPWADAAEFTELDPHWEPSYGGDLEDPDAAPPDADTEVTVPSPFRGIAELRRFVTAHAAPAIQRHFESMYGWGRAEPERYDDVIAVARRVAHALPGAPDSRVAAEALWWAFGGPASSLQVYTVPGSSGPWWFLSSLAGPCTGEVYDALAKVAPSPVYCTPRATWRRDFGADAPSAEAGAILRRIERGGRQQQGAAT